MSILEQQVQGLGIGKGTSLFVHCSLKAIGAGTEAGTLISALRGAVGGEGTLMFPTFTSRQEDYFDPDNTASIVGVVTEVFRKMPGTLRSRHPRHPVAAQGAMAQQLVDGHENAIGPCGVDTPFERHARIGGQILLIGVDFDTLTLLHTAEAILDLPYLRELDGKYLDKNGKVQQITMRQAPGGHRGGVRSFEKVFRQRGLISYGRIGNAKTILMDAGPVLDSMIELLCANPAAALCRGDYCGDCVDFKAKIRAKQLAELGAELSIILPGKPKNPNSFKKMLERFGITPRFELVSELNIVKLKQGQHPPMPPNNDGPWILQPTTEDLVKAEKLPDGYAGFAYAPLEAARAGIQPFYGVLYKGKCRDYITDIFIEDGLTGLAGTMSPSLEYLSELVTEKRIVLGQGHGQLREIISAMRMRNFSGRYHIVVGEGNLYAETMRLLKEFWALLP